MTPPHYPPRDKIHADAWQAILDADAQQATRDLDVARVAYMMDFDLTSIKHPTQAEYEQALKQFDKSRNTYIAAHIKCTLAVNASLHIETPTIG